MIQSTSGMSRPRAATSVQTRMPLVALQNSKKVAVRLACFCRPCWLNGWLIGCCVGQQMPRCEHVDNPRRKPRNAYVELQHGDIDVVEQFGVVFDRVARGKEHDHLLLQVLRILREWVLCEVFWNMADVKRMVHKKDS